LGRDKYERDGDLFEDLKEYLGCLFISDIDSEEFRCKACLALISSAFTGYAVEQWQDMMEYLSLNQYTQITNENEAKLILQEYLMKKRDLPW